MTRHIHVIGGGVSGPAAALPLSLMGEPVTLYEAAPFAGGRCRSYFDNELGCRLDNGNHLVLSGNVAIQDYLYLSEPLTIAALNTEPQIASARLLSNVFRQTFAAGGSACCPLMPKVGLSESFITPCIDVLRERGVEIKFNHRLRTIEMVESPGHR